MKYKLKRKYRLLLVCLLAVGLISTGSLAWRDNSQHKTNKLQTLPSTQNTVLVEKFKPIEDWKLGQTVEKKVYVKNGQSTDDSNHYDYKDSYVRVQVREFLGISKNNVTKTDFRLLTDEKGNFIKFDQKSEAEEKAKSMKFDNPSSRVVELKGYDDDKNYFYIKVFIEDQLVNNGKYLVTEVEKVGLESLETGAIVNNLDDSIKENHNTFNPSGSNIEDSNIFATHMWEHDKENLTPDSNIFREFVTIEMGDDVISYESWINEYDMKPVKKWIADTSLTGEGWLYWGMPLSHDKGENQDSVTSNLIENITLVKEGNGTIDYRMHINLDAVTKKSLKYWGNAPKELMKMYEQC